MAADAVMSAEKEEMAIDMMIAMVVDMLADETGQAVETVMPRFLQSRVCAMLYDRKTKLWWQGPSDIAAQYLEEIQNGEKPLDNLSVPVS